jgi:topoisomerase IA-like protein
MAKYSKTAQDKVEKSMHEMKRGQLKSGGSGKKVTNPKQAIAIGLSEAREKGAKVPKKKSAPKKAAAKKTGPKKSAAKKTATKKSASKKSAGKKPGPKKGAAKKK